MRLRLTQGGKDILLQSLEGGASPSFVSIVLGNGENAGENANALSNCLVTIPLSSIEREDGSDFVTLTGSLSNGTIESRFRATETGVMCVDPTDTTGNTSLLFAYGYANEEEALVIPSRNDYAFEIVEKCLVYVGATTDVTAVIAASAVYPTKEEFLNHANSIQNPHRVSAEQIGLGNVANQAPPDITPAFDDSGIAANAVVLQSGAPLKILFRNLAAHVRNLMNHIASRANPHGVTYAQVGAARSSHSHSAAHITSGIIPVGRGGTGVGSLSALADNLGHYMNTARTGVYTGNGTVKRKIELGFTPTAVMIVDDTGMAADDIKGTCGGLAVGSYGVAAYGSSGSYGRTWNDSYTCIMITDGGFYVNYQSNTKARTNTSGVIYRYIAWGG